jgi:2-(1,2-epoxy-1,2-dihydrophenyl)acetyl-CoA isomerase
MSATIGYNVSGGVATITLDRPDSLNSLNLAMKVELLDALERARNEPAVRAVLLTGAGRAFCVGQDLREHADDLEAGRTELNTVTEHYNPIVTALTSLPMPVIAAVNGMAAGAGAALAFACDFRIAADGAGFLLAFARVGLGPDSGSSWTLQRLIGLGRATALLMLAEPVTAQQALEMGLVNGVVPTDELVPAATELAGRLAAGPTVAYAAIKQTLAFSATHDLPDSLAQEAQAQARCGATEDHRNAVQAFLAKEQTSFTGR